MGDVCVCVCLRRAQRGVVAELGQRGDVAQREIKYINMLFGWLCCLRYLPMEAEIRSCPAFPLERRQHRDMIFIETRGEMESGTVILAPFLNKMEGPWKTHRLFCRLLWLSKAT